MKYLLNIVKKEIKAAFYNKKVFIVTVISQIIILALIIRSTGLFQSIGFHSMAFSIDLVLIASICQIMPQSYFYDQETGVENLLLLSRKFNTVIWVRICLYSIITILQLLLIVLVFKFLFNINVYSDYIESFLNLINCINFVSIEMIIVLITKDRNLSSYLSFALLIVFNLCISYMFPVLLDLFNLIGIIVFELLIIMVLILILKLVLTLSYKIYR